MVGTKGQQATTLSSAEASALVSFLCLHVDAFRAVTRLAVDGPNFTGAIADAGGGLVSIG